MDHNKITEKRMRAAEELRKKKEAKNKKAGIKTNSTIPSYMSHGASLRQSNITSTMRGPGGTMISNDKNNLLTSSIINDRDA